ncbi:MAG TPA: NAD-dependent epimerase/dehydratase family protein [Phototrophicaceae bacterium]|nr:NAD-dependent epimerase/dehydratase family protein [Phototrophicaceae bacterium]
MKALVTGATGFVGAHIVRLLSEQGHSPVALHRASSRLDALAGLTYASALGDVTDLEALRQASVGCDWVFHVAAVADYWRADKARMYEVNVEGTRKVLQAARENGVQRVVFTSSAAAVGFHDDRPSNEQDAFNLAPERFPYGHSKALAEAVAQEAVQAGQEVVIVNPVVVLGPGDLNIISGDFVLKIKRLQWTVPVPPGGVAVIDVRDVARMHIAAATQGQVGERYILGTANYPYRQWFGMVADGVGAAHPALPTPRWALPPLAALFDGLRALGLQPPVDGNQTRLGARNIYFDFSKGWNALGQPQIDMQQSIADTYSWYREHGYVKDDWLAKVIDRLTLSGTRSRSI